MARRSLFCGALLLPEGRAGRVNADHFLVALAANQARASRHGPMTTLVTRTAWAERILSASLGPGGSSPEAMRRRILVRSSR